MNEEKSHKLHKGKKVIERQCVNWLRIKSTVSEEHNWQKRLRFVE